MKLNKYTNNELRRELREMIKNGHSCSERAKQIRNLLTARKEKHE